ncbi:MAG: four helix bundle protein [Bacteroidetes bacterium]|nr:MAG: four helix bundle protein [Bacteroidota bacterium]
MESKSYSFEKLHVWKDIRGLIKDVYELTATLPEIEKFGLVMQMRRAAISVSSNLAEGSSRTSPKDQAHFYQISYSSMMELLSQLIVSYDLKYITESSYSALRQDIEGITYKLNSLRSTALKRIKSK